MRFFILSGFLIGSLSTSVPAHSQGCPPGFVPIGPGMCLPLPQQQAPEPQQRTAPPPSVPPRPLTKEEMEQASKILYQQQARENAKHQLEVFGNGKWIYGDRECAATFINKYGLVAIGVFKNKPYLMFASPDIPITTKVETIKINLERFDQTPQQFSQSKNQSTSSSISINALHGSKPIGNGAMGVYQIFDLPLLKNGFSNLPDAAVFRLSNPKPVLAFGWPNAAEARDKLRQCYK
jgi:hypothetical protein